MLWPLRSPGRPGPPKLERAVLKVASAAVFGSVLSTMDGTIVNIALNTIRREFHTTLTAVQWVTTGYLLALALTLPVSGWLADRLGARRLYLGCLLAFSAASALCGAAPSIGWLIALRIVQGMVGGLLAPLGQTLVAQVAGRERLGRVMSIVAIPTLIGPILGPTVGGAIVAHASWRWIFYVNLPLGIAGAAFAARRLPPDPPAETAETRRRLDATGLALIGPGLGLLVYAVSRIAQSGDPTDPTALALGATGAGLLGMFTVHALHLGESALLDLRLFKDKAFAAGTATAFLSRLTGDGVVLLLPLYLQQVRAMSPLTAGAVLAPQGLGAMLALPLAGRFTDTYGPRRTACAGAVLGLLGTAGLLTLSPSSPLVWLCLLLFLRGLGASLAGLPPVAAAYRSLSRHEAAGASTTLNIAQRLGSPLGTAALAVVLAAATRTADTDPVRLSHGFTQAFAAATAATALLLAASLTLPGPPEPQPGDHNARCVQTH
ncbi:MDR family MFS transporter [Kitasatospora sp. NPDC096128]|uniref:MDR family MFS transporter n=1 Tax=Kitasatospora sp. NPDC096128 TaxID=3155547 RepID=UPI0033316BC3